MDCEICNSMLKLSSVGAHMKTKKHKLNVTKLHLRKELEYVKIAEEKKTNELRAELGKKQVELFLQKKM